MSALRATDADPVSPLLGECLGEQLRIRYIDIDENLLGNESVDIGLQIVLAEKRIEVELIDLPGEQIPLDDNSVDSVLVTYTFCSIDDTAAALHGIRRVLKPGGHLFFCEHGKAPDQDVCRWQDRLNPAWRRFSGGCNMNRDIPALLKAGGFILEDDNRMYIPGIRALSYNYWGAAR